MKSHLRILLIGVIALLAVGALSACSSGTKQATESSPKASESTAAPFPQSAKYIADTTSSDGKPMVIGIAVVGDQKDGKIDLTSRFKDTLRAQFDGKDVVGDLTMNGVAFRFSAPAVPAPAGMYTAEFQGVRASWVVRPDGSATGVQFNGGVSGR